MLDRARRWLTRAWQTISTWSFPSKIAIGALIGAFGGSGYLGLLSEFAAYSYAVHYGARPPLEGIPYLRPFVTLSTLTLLLAAAFVFWLVYRFGRTVLGQFELIFRSGRLVVPRGADLEQGLELLRSRPGSQFLSAALLASLTIAVVVGLIEYTYSSVPLDLLAVVWLPASIFLFGFITASLLWRPSLIWWLAACLTVLFVVVSPAVLFNAHYYGTLLRAVGYGGGVHVVVETEVAGQEETVEGALVLRTSTALLLYDPTTREIVEIQLERVGVLKHPAGNLLKLSYSLPH